MKFFRNVPLRLVHWRTKLCKCSNRNRRAAMGSAFGSVLLRLGRTSRWQVYFRKIIKIHGRWKTDVANDMYVQKIFINEPIVLTSKTLLHLCNTDLS